MESTTDYHKLLTQQVKEQKEKRRLAERNLKRTQTKLSKERERSAQKDMQLRETKQMLHKKETRNVKLQSKIELIQYQIRYAKQANERIGAQIVRFRAEAEETGQNAMTVEQAFAQMSCTTTERIHDIHQQSTEEPFDAN